MTKNPFLNAFAALGYIMVVTAVMNYGSSLTPQPNQMVAPIAFLSLFTLSAAVMAYIFGYQPIMLLIENKKKQAVQLFLQTLAVFGGITVLALVLVFSGLL